MAKHLAQLSPAAIWEVGHKHTAPEASMEEEMPAGCIWQGTKEKDELNNYYFVHTQEGKGQYFYNFKGSKKQ